jgi:ADP-heptose:LPS heptosyltransferase
VIAFRPGSLFEARRLLVIRVDEVGDFVLSSALLRELRRSAPNAHITLIVKARVRSLADACPYVDRVLTYDWESCPWSNRRTWHLKWKALRLWLSSLRGISFDRVLLPRRDDDIYGAEFLASLCAPRKQIACCRSGFSSSEVNHEVEHSLAFLNWCGGNFTSDRLEIWTNPEDEAWAESYLETHRSSGRFLLVVHPSGGRSPLKQWPVGRYAETLRTLKTKKDFLCLIIGGSEEKELGRHLRAADASLIDATGELTLRQTAALLRRADLFFGGDSGPMHIAAAAGVRVVALFGPTNIARFKPHGEIHRIVSLRLPCSPNSLGQFQDKCWVCIYPQPLCMTELPVELALEEILRAWPEREGERA